MRIETEVINEDLPTGFDVLRTEARAEGFRQIERLRTDWDGGTMRFDRDGEVLLTVRVNGTLAAIGGLTLETVVPSALRMRRFYVRPAFRLGGVGRELVLSLLARTRSSQLVTVNAAAESVPFLGGNELHARSARRTHTHHPQSGRPSSLKMSRSLINRDG